MRRYFSRVFIIVFLFISLICNVCLADAYVTVVPPEYRSININNQNNIVTDQPDISPTIVILEVLIAFVTVFVLVMIIVFEIHNVRNSRIEEIDE